MSIFALVACTPPPGSAVPATHHEAQTPEAQKLDAQRLEAQELARLPPVALKGANLDHSGRNQVGRASYYARQFANRKMAGGNRLDLNADTAASKNLPLGTTAKITNVQNGKSATVRVEDRGPFIDGRVVDVTPAVADQLAPNHGI